jgi:short-subunit dehydrogenase
MPQPHASGNYALLLGATSDVARALALQLAARKYGLYLAGRNKEALDRMAKDIAIKFNIQPVVLPFDAEDFASHRAFVEQLQPFPHLSIAVFGYLGHHDIAVKNNEEMLRILNVNFVGAASIFNLLAAQYEMQKDGCMVGISSVAGDRGRQSNYYYGSAKAGFTAFLSGLRNRLQTSGVHVLTAKPGFIATRMTEGLDLPAPLTARPEQVARDILKGVDRKKNVVYTLWMWRYIMLIIKSIPEGIFKKLKL